MAKPENPPALNRRLRPKTYSVAVYVVALFLVLEVGLLGLIFWFRQSVVRIETSGPAINQSAEVSRTKTVSTEPLRNLPQPNIDARLTIKGRTEKNEAEILRLNDEAQKFRRDGNFELADAALKQALELDANNPRTLTGLAMLDESRGNNVKALEDWQKIIRLGDRAASLLPLARERASLIEERDRLEQEARLREQVVLSLKRSIVVDGVKTIPDPLPAAPVEIQKDFSLRLKDKKLRVDPSKLKVQIFFYDRIGDSKLVPAKIEGRFMNNLPDWSKGDVEILHTRYFAPAGGAAGQEKAQYYGYLIRIYYGGILQDEQAEPLSLLRLFPSER